MGLQQIDWHSVDQAISIHLPYLGLSGNTFASFVMGRTCGAMPVMVDPMILCAEKPMRVWRAWQETLGLPTALKKIGAEHVWHSLAQQLRKSAYARRKNIAGAAGPVCVSTGGFSCLEASVWSLSVKLHWRQTVDCGQWERGFRENLVILDWVWVTFFPHFLSFPSSFDCCRGASVTLDT